ncbi:MAG: dipeptide epimerase [Planctomycetota bacterium]
MLRLTLHPVELPLRHTWTIAHGTRTVQRNLIVALHDPDTGHTGYGEAPGIPYMGVELPQMVRFLRETDHTGIGTARIPLDEAELLRHKNYPGQWFFLRDEPGGSLESWMFAHAALDEARYDLWGKTHGRSVRETLAPNHAAVPRSDYTIGLDTPEMMAEKLRGFPDFPVYKIKLGSPPGQGGVSRDLDIVRRLRDETDVPFRVDANTAWTANDTIRISQTLRDLGVEFIEQPLAPELPREEHEAVYFGSDLPIIADESCQADVDIAKCEGLFHGVNIKLSKCGGMTPARIMIADARRRGLRVMAGCMTESTVGISALAQLLPLLDEVDMDGALLLAEGADVAEGVRLRTDGTAAFPEGSAGHGNAVRLTRRLPAVANPPQVQLKRRWSLPWRRRGWTST